MDKKIPVGGIAEPTQSEWASIGKPTGLVQKVYRSWKDNIRYNASPEEWNTRRFIESPVKGSLSYKVFVEWTKGKVYQE